MQQDKDSEISALKAKIAVLEESLAQFQLTLFDAKSPAPFPLIEFHVSDWLSGFGGFADDGGKGFKDGKAICTINLREIAGSTAVQEMDPNDAAWFVARTAYHSTVEVIEKHFQTELSGRKLMAMLEPPALLAVM